MSTVGMAVCLGMLFWGAAEDAGPTSWMPGPGLGALPPPEPPISRTGRLASVDRSTVMSIWFQEGKLCSPPDAHRLSSLGLGAESIPYRYPTMEALLLYFQLLFVRRGGDRFVPRGGDRFVPATVLCRGPVL